MSALLTVLAIATAILLIAGAWLHLRILALEEHARTHRDERRCIYRSGP